jgi:hypothetical protein
MLHLLPNYIQQFATTFWEHQPSGFVQMFPKKSNGLGSAHPHIAMSLSLTDDTSREELEERERYWVVLSLYQKISPSANFHISHCMLHIHSITESNISLYLVPFVQRIIKNVQN